MKIRDLSCPNCGTPLPSDSVLKPAVECQACGSTVAVTELDQPKFLTCPKCQKINPADRQYCSECGQTLFIQCILCHQKNSFEVTHCSRCGVNLKRNQLRRQKMMDDRKKTRQERNQFFKEKVIRQQAEKLQQLLNDLDEPENHDFAIYQINRMGASAVSALIETLLHDEDPDARYGSARALGQICQEHEVKALIKARSAKALIKALTDSDVRVRYWAADALGKCGSQIAVEPLAKLLKYENHHGVRQQAKESLLEIGGEQAHQALADSERSKGVFGWIKGD